MGEYASFNGKTIWIGTCDVLSQLRVDQIDRVTPVPHSVDVARHRNDLAFRFPFPYEDNTDPGAFADSDHIFRLPGFKVTGEGKHGHVQFVASIGYNVCLPCPEGFDQPEIGSATVVLPGARVHRNGFSGGIGVAGQRYIDGELWTILACRSCGHRWRIDRDEAVKVTDHMTRLAANAPTLSPGPSAATLAEMARRIMAGYTTP